MLGDCAAMAQEVDGNQIGCRSQFLVCKLRAIQVTACHEGVGKDDSWLRCIVFVRHLVGDVDAAEMRDLDCFDIADTHCD